MNDLTKLAQLAEQHSSSYASPHHFVLSVAGLRSIIAALAALRDAPQAEGWVMVKTDSLKALRASIRGDYYMGEDWEQETIDAMLAATPSAPTAVEPDERDLFEAWYFDTYTRPIDKQDDGQYSYTAERHMWAAWLARASKGTPL